MLQSPEVPRAALKAKPCWSLGSDIWNAPPDPGDSGAAAVLDWRHAAPSQHWHWDHPNPKGGQGNGNAQRKGKEGKRRKGREGCCRQGQKDADELRRARDAPALP